MNIDRSVGSMFGFQSFIAVSCKVLALSTETLIIGDKENSRGGPLLLYLAQSKTIFKSFKIGNISPLENNTRLFDTNTKDAIATYP